MQNEKNQNSEDSTQPTNHSNGSDHDHDHNHSEDGAAKSSARDKRYWLSLEQWGGDPEFQKLAETEFMSSPIREGAESEGQDGWARREFLKLMGASLAMASASCIRRPVQKIVPYNKQPEEVTHGISNFYTSTWSDGVETFGLLVKSREGRPTKVEGNPNHPLSKGGLSPRAQAHILSLYDPERIQGPKRNLQNKERTNRDTISAKWEDLDTAALAQLKKGGIVVLTGALSSPATRAVISDFCQGFKAKHVTWEPLSHEEIREGQKASFGDDVVPYYRFDQAKVIVSVDADFLGTWIAPTTFTKQFSASRRDPKKMSKLVVFDSGYSLTGANADIRVRIKPSQQLDVLMGLAHEIVVKKSFGKYASNSLVKASLEPFAGAAAKLSLSKEVWAKLVEDLIQHRGQSLIVAGGLQTLTAQAREVQIAVNFLNAVLGNDGTTVDAKVPLTSARASNREFQGLIEDLNSGKVKTVIIHETNPVYSAENSGFTQALKKAEMVFYTGDRMDETAKQADFVIPDNHAMEAWDDSESYKDVISLQQPTIRPLYDTRSFQLSLMTWAYMGETGPKRLTTPESYYEYLRNYWKDELHGKFGKGKSFEDFWQEALQTGVITSSDLDKTSGERLFKVEALSSVKPVTASGMELLLYPTSMFMDGTLSNVSWLNELPDPVTKVVWDNYVSLSIATAEKMKVEQGDVLEVIVGEKSIKVPVLIQPGLHDEVMAVAVGYGRTAGGKVTNGVGSSAYQLVNYSKSGVIYSGLSVEAKKTGLKTKIACTQGHHSMEGRKIVAEATLNEYMKDEAANNHKHKIWSIWSGHQYNGNKWGMAVDLNTCTGCSACMVACQSENNISVVGKKYVLEGREMHWIRIDRYYVGDPTDANAVFQPIMCQHCDNAPCETVCPVLATVHSSEGLNDMVYNRCVGTRYCSNNCPYKVRRFNWFNFAKLIEKPMHLALNPEVTVRPRGVMEKCTFCTHRIKEARVKARVESRDLKDGDVKTACEQSCPAGAITFGDMNDPNSRVAKIFKEDQRAYALLEEFHAAPSVRYMTKIRNNDKGSEAGHHGGGHS
jgi:MoCo/4Fe-4S cofactor protein with predicted Tat translocation signal